MFTASGKAKTDAEDIAEACGFKNIGVKRTYYPIGWKTYLNILQKYTKVFCKLNKDNLVFLQHPFGWALKFLKLAKKRGNKVILLIHDLNALRDWSDEGEKEALNEADVLIVHTQAMKDWLQKMGLGKKHVVLGCFDYLYGDNVKIPAIDDGYKIAFTGNLKKSVFLDKVDLKKTKLHLYGIGIEERTLPNNVVYKGCFPPEKLASKMSEHFGLVWDGDSASTCSGQLGEYLKLIAPHKFSMYLSAGLPVIVWSESALAPFVKEHNIGLSVSSLKEMDEKIAEISPDAYDELVKNVTSIQKKLSQGDFLKEAIKKAEKILSD